jgi:hypothetical protein
MRLKWIGAAFVVALLLLGVLYALQPAGARDARGAAAEGFDGSNALQQDLGKLIKSVTGIGKKLLDPEIWNYRIQLMHLTPIELARKQINADS